MLRSLSRWLLLVTLLAFTAALHAQQAPRATQADPLDATAIVPPSIHASSLSQYRKLTDEPVISWRDANETVNRIGGWRAYAREASQPDTPSVRPEAPAGSAK